MYLYYNLLVVVITKSLNSNFCAFWLVPVTRNILGYSLFCDQSRDGVCFETFSKDEIWAINEAVVQANTKKATSFNVLGNKRDGAVVRAFSPTNVTQVQIPASTPYVGWVCCWFSPLLREVFLQVLRFSPLLKNQHFQIPIRSGIG